MKTAVMRDDATDYYAADMDREHDLEERHRALTERYTDMARSRPHIVNELVCDGLASVANDSRNLSLIDDPLTFGLWARDLLLREVQRWAAEAADKHIAGKAFDPDREYEVEE